jgi:hypothetical protein
VRGFQDPAENHREQGLFTFALCLLAFSCGSAALRHPLSSFRFYNLGDEALRKLDRMS